MSGERMSANPFHVLGLRPDCGRAEVEREGQKLLAMLELDLAAARTYASPLGSHTRTAELVREAMAELRDPQRRLVHELWAALPSEGATASEPESTGDAPPERPTPRWPDALARLGFTPGSRP
jgi:hypothetical protein